MRIVATGTGIISSLGAGAGDFEAALYAGRTGIGPKTLFADSVPGGAAGEIRDFAPQQWLGSKGLRVLDRSARLLCVAAHMALESSGLSQQRSAEGDADLGLVCGTMFGSVHSIASFDWSGLLDGPNLVNPMEFPNTVINSPAGQAAIKHRLRGVNSTISAGLVSGLYAIHYAMEFLRFGRAQALLAGGVEELCEESYLSCKKSGITSPQDRIRPFAPDRDGTVLGEGSALLVLETEEAAIRRAAKPFLEVCGFGSSHDAHSIDTFNVRAPGSDLSHPAGAAGSGNRTRRNRLHHRQRQRKPDGRRHGGARSRECLWEATCRHSDLRSQGGLRRSAGRFRSAAGRDRGNRAAKKTGSSHSRL